MSNSGPNSEGEKSPQSSPKVGKNNPPVEHRFKKGKSGNPGGYSKKQRAQRELLSKILDKAFTRDDGSDILIDALVSGVQNGDSTLTRIAAEYRWGKPSQRVELDDVTEEPTERQLERIQHILAVVTDKSE